MHKSFASINFYILRLIPDFVTEEEEAELLQTFHWEENDGKMKHRQVWKGSTTLFKMI